MSVNKRNKDGISLRTIYVWIMIAALIISGLMWSVLAAVHITFLYFKINVALIYFLGAAGQIVIIMWSFIKKPKTK